MRLGPCLAAPRRHRPPYGGTEPSCTTHSNTPWNSACSAKTPLRRLSGRHRRQQRRLTGAAWSITFRHGDCSPPLASKCPAARDWSLSSPSSTTQHCGQRKLSTSAGTTSPFHRLYEMRAQVNDGEESDQ